jgi:hypothetical protein
VTAKSASALAWLAALVTVPVLVWHRMLGDVLGQFRFSLRYLVAELSPWLLLLAGLAFLVPVALSSGRDPESRLYPRARRVYFAWGITLYLLGTALAIQVADIWSYAH